MLFRSTSDAYAESWIQATGEPPYDVPTTLYWSNKASQQVARWSLDSGGVYQSGSFLSPDELYSDETSLNADLNADSIIGASFRAIESQGNATLLRRNDGKAYVDVGSERFVVTSPFNLGTEDPSGEWQMLAAETVDGKNQILWRNIPSGFLHLWTLNEAWDWKSSAGRIDPLSTEAHGLEISFQLNLQDQWFFS